MSGRRLTISSLLCADDEATDEAQPEATHPHSLHTPVGLSGPGVPPVEFRPPSARDHGYSDSHRVAYRSRAYSDYDRGNHESVSLSLQPMHLPRGTPSPPTDDALAYSVMRRDYRGDVSGRSEVVAGNSRPISREHEIPSYASHHLPPATSRQSSSSRRSSDPIRQEYRLYEGSSYFSPPASSRSSQADYLTTPSAFPLQPPPLPHTHSYSPPQHSPPQHVSPTIRRPSQTPALGLHHITDSPPITIGRMSRPQSNSPGLVYSLQSPRHPQSPPGPPLTGSPSHESLTGLSTHRRSASFSQQEVPFVTPRPSSVTSLLNTEPARSPVVRMGTHGSPGGLEGLAALAEVAVTEARRRVSGDLPSPAEVRETARRASLSPALTRSPILNRGPPSLHQPSLSPVLQRSPMLPSPRDTRVNSLGVISLTAVSSHDGEPPSKRRRRTGSSGTGHAHVPPPPAPPVPQTASPTAPMLSHPSHLVLESSTPHYATRVPPPPHPRARPVTPPPETPEVVHTAKPTSISQLLSAELPLRDVSAVNHSQAPPAVQETTPAEHSERPNTPEAQYLPVEFKAEGKIEDVASGSLDSRANMDEVREGLGEPPPAAGREETDHPVRAVPAEEEEIPTPVVAMEEEEDVPGPALVLEEEEPPVLPAPVKMEEPPLSLTTQLREEESSVAEVDDVPMPSAAELPQDVPMSPAPAEPEDVEMHPVPESVQDVRDVPGQSFPNTPDVPVRSAPVDVPAISMPPAPEVPSGSLDVTVEARPVSPETEGTTCVPAEPAARTDDVCAVSRMVTKAEEDLSTLPRPAAMKHEFGETSYISPPAVSHLSGHEGAQTHSHPEHRRQEDPHEWLLEHYADSPARDSRRSSPAPEEPPRTPYLSDGSPPPPPPPPVKDSPPILSPSKRAHRHKEAPTPPRSPTPTALLEQELDGISPMHEDDVAHVPRSPQSDADTDFGLEFDLAANAAPDRDVDPDVSMGDELDDELLSLVDDQPRHTHSHSHPHPHLHHAPSAKASHMSTATVGLELPPLFKDPVAKEPIAAALSPPPPPPPPPPPILSTSVPPASISPPTQVAKPAAQQSVSKRDKAGSSAKLEGTSVSASMKKKESAPKPIAKEKEKTQEKAEETQERPQEMPDKAQEKPKPKPKPRPVAKSKAAKAIGEKDSAAGSSGRLTPSGSATVTKAKGKKSAAANAAVAAVAAKRGVSTATGASRSRSVSEMPTPAEPPPKIKPPPAPQPEEEEASEEEVVDDKLYCICKTSYDEDKVMIACDRCDEWYHTQCLNIDDLEVDLIDQFVCPPCVMANPNLSLKTTYKARCMAGLKHPRPSSSDACHKPARGAFSKFCSDECGIAYMQRRIEGWGGSQAVLWASVKDTKQREGVVVKVQVLGSPDGASQDEKRPGATLGHLIQEAHEVQQPTKTQRDRKIARLQAQLDKLAPKREEVKKDLEVIVWRQKLLHLASARADSLKNECGWDQRLCMDDEDYADYGRAILDSYQEGHAQPNGVDAMHVDGTLEAGEWWCRGVRKCPRHAGWQKLRTSEFEFDRKAKEDAISALTAKEREIRGQLEDAISLPVRKTMVPLQLLNGHQADGVKAKPNGTSGRKGKQKN